MAMNYKGIMTRINELRDGIEATKEAKEEALSNAEDREDGDEVIDRLQTNIDVLENALQCIEDAISELENWEA